MGLDLSREWSVINGTNLSNLVNNPIICQQIATFRPEIKNLTLIILVLYLSLMAYYIGNDDGDGSQ